MIPAKISKYAGGLVGALALGALACFSIKLALGLLGALAAVAFFYIYPQAAFYVLVAYLPFQLALNLSTTVDLLSGRVLVLIFSAVWLARSLKEKKFFLSKGQSTFALTLFFSLAAISVLVAQNQGWAVRKLLVFVSVFPLFFLTRFLVQNISQRKKIIWILIGSAATSAAIALVQFGLQFLVGMSAVFNFWAKYIVPLFLGNSFGVAVLQNPSWFVEIHGQPLMRAIGLFPDPHMLSFFLGMILPLALGMFFYEKRWRKLLFAAFCTILVALVLTFSRGGYVGALSGLLVAGALIWRKLEIKGRALMAGFLFVLATITFLTPVFGRFFSSFDLAEGSNLGRLGIWVQSLEISKTSPLLGVGLGNYPFALNFNENYRSAVTSHNLYLDILVETGAFGLLAWFWFLFSAVRNCWQAMKNKSDFVFAAASGLLGSLAYFAAHSFFETAIFNPTILALLMLLTGLAAGVKNYESK